MNMPKLNGFQVIKKIRNNNNFQNIPVIAVSAYADPDNIKRILNSGSDDYISKPINKNKLINKIKKYVYKKTNFNLNKNNIKLIHNLISELENNIKIFNPDSIMQVSKKLDKLSDIDFFNDIKQQLIYASENFDDNCLKNCIIKLKEVINYDTK
jgi:response regulator RpfG family c-di-GMP phosphodiesterase